MAVNYIGKVSGAYYNNSIPGTQLGDLLVLFNSGVGGTPAGWQDLFYVNGTAIGYRWWTGNDPSTVSDGFVAAWRGVDAAISAGHVIAGGNVASSLSVPVGSALIYVQTASAIGDEDTFVEIAIGTTATGAATTYLGKSDGNYAGSGNGFGAFYALFPAGGATGTSTTSAVVTSGWSPAYAALAFALRPGEPPRLRKTPIIAWY